MSSLSLKLATETGTYSLNTYEVTSIQLRITEGLKLKMKYAALWAKYEEFQNEGSNDSSRNLTNVKTALKSWLTSLGLESSNFDAPIGIEFNSRFDANLGAFSEHLEAAGLSRQTVFDRRSLIKKLHEFYQQLQTLDWDNRDLRFAKKLRALLEQCDLSQGELARQSGVPLRSIEKMLRGTSFTKTAGMANIAKLENYFIQRGELTNKGELRALAVIVSDYITTKASGKFKTSAKLSDHFEKYHRPTPLNKKYIDSGLEIPRLYLDELPESFRLLWTDFFRGRVESKRFKSRPITTIREHKSNPRHLEACMALNSLGEKVVYHSASIQFNELQSYLSYLVNVRKNGKLDIDTLDPSVFFSSSLIYEYLDFLAQRADGVVSTRYTRAKSMIYTLGNHRSTKINLRQSFLKGEYKLIAEIDNIDLEKKSDREKILTEFDRWYTDRRYDSNAKSIQKARDPFKTIEPFLDLDEPFQPLINIVKQLDKLNESTSKNKYRHAENARGALLIHLIMQFPIRYSNLIDIKFFDNPNSKTKNNFYKDSEDNWWIDINLKDLKNSKPYKRKLDKQLGTRLEKYLLESRPIFYRNHNREDDGLVFPGKTGRWHSIDSWLARATMKVIGWPIRPHGIRHLAASRFLKKNPGQFHACAALIGDSVSVTMSTYLHVCNVEKLSDEELSSKMSIRF